MTVIDWFVIILQFVALAMITINLTLIVIYIIFRIIRKLKNINDFNYNRSNPHLKILRHLFRQWITKKH